MYRLLHVPVGFDPDHLATLRVMAPGAVYNSDEQIVGLYRELTRRLSSLPGVESVGATSMLPVECNCAIDRIQFPGRPYHGEHNDVDERHVSPEYLSTLRARLLRGRRFTEADDASHPGVAIINQILAQKYFPGQDPIGQRIANDEGGRPSVWEIVGVVDDVREGPLDVDTWPAEYFPINQTRDHDFSLAVRTRQDAGALLPVLVSTLHQIDPGLGVSDEATMNDKIDGTQAALLHRFSAWLVGGFAAVALILGVVGLYGADCLFGEPADAGDWCAHGAGGTARLSLWARNTAGSVADCSRLDHWAGLLSGDIDVDAQLVVRRARMGRSDSGCSSFIARAGVIGGEFRTRASRGFCRSHAGVTKRMMCSAAEESRYEMVAGEEAGRRF